MSADRLREAARVLRERAEAASVEAEPPWVMSGQWIESHNGTEIPTSPENNGNEQDEVSAYIATMHPGVGLALADWLETAGADLWAHGPLCECGSGCLNCDGSLWQPHARRALALADLILGGAVDG